jgi:predicted SAM-dependent methyltransferase
MKYGLNLGSGKDFRTSTSEIEWTNVDADPNAKPDIVGSVEYLGSYFRADRPLVGHFDEIIARDILEHIPHMAGAALDGRWHTVLKGWIECLRPGGTIFLQVPCLQNIYEAMATGAIDEETANRVIYGESTDSWDRHYQLFSLLRLRTALESMGLDIVESYNLHVCAIVVGRKPE